MKVKTLDEKIIDKLVEYGIKIYKKNNQIEETIIMADKMIISVIENNEILINFHICSKPSYAARIIVILKEIKNVKKIMVGEDFLFNDNGKYLEGNDAIKEFENFQEENIINDFLNEQKTLYLLTHIEGVPC
jgi:hypothetical protein